MSPQNKKKKKTPEAGPYCLESVVRRELGIGLGKER